MPSLLRLLHVQPQAHSPQPLSEDLLAFVRSLSYASFQSAESPKESPKETDDRLEPWQLEHATAILKQSEELDGLRFVLCPKCGSYISVSTAVRNAVAHHAAFHHVIEAPVCRVASARIQHFSTFTSAELQFESGLCCPCYFDSMCSQQSDVLFGYQNQAAYVHTVISQSKRRRGGTREVEKLSRHGVGFSLEEECEKQAWEYK
jgi:hypothetical protein